MVSSRQRSILRKELPAVSLKLEKKQRKSKRKRISTIPSLDRLLIIPGHAISCEQHIQRGIWTGPHSSSLNLNRSSRCTRRRAISDDGNRWGLRRRLANGRTQPMCGQRPATLARHRTAAIASASRYCCFRVQGRTESRERPIGLAGVGSGTLAARVNWRVQWSLVVAGSVAATSNRSTATGTTTTSSHGHFACAHGEHGVVGLLSSVPNSSAFVRTRKSLGLVVRFI
jgi:hypothetical protein